MCKQCVHRIANVCCFTATPPVTPASSVGCRPLHCRFSDFRLGGEMASSLHGSWRGCSLPTACDIRPFPCELTDQQGGAAQGRRGGRGPASLLSDVK